MIADRTLLYMVLAIVLTTVIVLGVGYTVEAMLGVS